jgi:nicotinamide-nucleotide amidase
MTDSDSIWVLAEALVGELIIAGKCISTAESCTGGWIAKSLTDISGSSQCFGYGVVSYSNGAKESMLGVATATLHEYGAVSEAVVREMATGVLNLSGADFSVAVSGVAGPDGGTDEKPVGTVWFGWATHTGQKISVSAEQHHLPGDRTAIRTGTVILALQGLREMLKSGG